MNNAIRMLLVEDNPGDSEYVQELLAGEREPEFSIVPVRRLSEAIRALSEGRYHIILLDLGLPDSQGMDTLTAVSGRSPAPIIIMTGLADEDFALRAIKAGAADYLIKGQINRILMIRTIRYAIERKRADEVLRESGSRLQLAIQAGHMVAWSWDAETKRMAVSENFPEMYGRPPITTAEEAYSLVHPEDLERHQSDVRSALIGGDSYRSEFRVIRPDNSEVLWIEERARIYRDHAGAVSRISGIAMDVTDRKRAEERIAHLASFPESNPAPIIELGLDGTITYTNPATRKRFPGIEKQGIRHPLLANWEEIAEGMRQAGAPTYDREVGVEGAYFHQLFFYSPSRTYFRIHNFEITERRLAEQALRDSEERYRITMETALDAIFTIDEDSRIVVVNPAVERIFGYRPEELNGRSLLVLMPERLRELHRNAVSRVVATGRRHLPWGAVELPGLHKDGREVPLEISYGEYHKDGQHFFIGVVRDISERKRAEESLRRRDAVLKQAGQMANVGAWEIEITDPENINASRLTWSEQVYRIFGYEPRSVEVTKPFFYERVHHDDRRKVVEAFELALSREKPYNIEHRIVRPDGTERIVWERAEVAFDSQGHPKRIVGAVQDITERKEAEEKIRYQAFHDLLTGLPNRDQLLIRLRLELVQHEKNKKKLAVMHIDLDRFRTINDTLGHAVGDKVIKAVTGRLRALVRRNDTLARIESDEFVILLADMQRIEEAGAFAQHAVTSMRQPLRVDGNELYTTVSIGISVYPGDGKTAEALLKNADIAVSSVKDWGRNNFQFFNPALNRRTVERLLLESNLRQSLERGEMEVHFQPQISIKTGRMIAVEALSRWRHPDLGMLDPSQYIPIAEEIGFISSIDNWVLRTAAAQNQRWITAGFDPICMTVNISAHQFQQASFIETVKSVLDDTGLEPRYLDIEITESTAMRDIEKSVPHLNRLHELGIDLSIDDFGTGYSSLNYLKRFPVHKLKIDKSFIHGLIEDRNDQAIVRAVIAMGHNLGMTVIAEGVETKEQLAFLKSVDCDEAQGFLFSEAVPADRLRHMLAA